MRARERTTVEEEIMAQTAEIIMAMAKIAEIIKNMSLRAELIRAITTIISD